MTEREQQLLKRQQMLADFGEFALRSDDLDAVLTEACRLVANALGTDRAKVLEIREDGRELLVRAGVGWGPDIVGRLRLSMSEASSETFSIEVGKPVITRDIRQETRFTFADFMMDEGVRALVNVPVFLPGGRAYGILQVDATEPQDFAVEDTEFLRTYATILGPVIDRLHKIERLRNNEEREQFLLAVSDTLRPMKDAVEIQRTATRMLGIKLKASRVFYVVVDDDGDTADIFGDYTDGVPTRVGCYSLSGFSTAALGEWRAGRIASTSDVDADARYSESERRAYASVSTRAGFGVPLIKEGRLVALLGVNQSSPRRWTDQDMQLAAEIAERTWAAAERARAEASVRESEGRYRTLFESIDEGFCIIEVIFNEQGSAVDYVFKEVNPAFERQTDILNAVGRSMREIAPDHEDHWFTIYGDIALTGEPQRFEAPAKQLGDRWYDLNAFRVGKPEQRRVAIVFNDVTQRHRDAAALRKSEALLRSFGDASSDLLWIRDAETLAWTYLTPAFETIYGLPREVALAGDTFRNWADLILDEDREAVLAAIDRVRAGERATFEYRIKRPVDGQIRWLRNTDFPIRDAGGAVVAIGGIGHDATVEKEAASRMEVLFAELQHRTRNLVGVVRATADRTARGASDLETFLPRFRERLGALSRINGLLSKLDKGERVTFDEMLRTELEARGFLDSGTERVVLDGPAGIRLRSATVQTFALAIHELATNAVKYGALSNDAGRLRVLWRLRLDGTGASRLQVEWIESGVADMPAADAPAQGSGYGRMLIEKALPYQLGATTIYEHRADGIRCTIDLPLR